VTTTTDRLADRILELLRAQPRKAREVVQALSDLGEQEVRRTIKALIEQGRVRPSAEWKLQICKADADEK
jgi:hypothetical protein